MEVIWVPAMELPHIDVINYMIFHVIRFEKTRVMPWIHHFPSLLVFTWVWFIERSMTSTRTWYRWIHFWPLLTLYVHWMKLGLVFSYGINFIQTIYDASASEMIIMLIGHGTIIGDAHYFLWNMLMWTPKEILVHIYA